MEGQSLQLWKGDKLLLCSTQDPITSIKFHWHFEEYAFKEQRNVSQRGVKSAPYNDGPSVVLHSVVITKAVHFLSPQRS